MRSFGQCNHNLRHQHSQLQLQIYISSTLTDIQKGFEKVSMKIVICASQEDSLIFLMRVRCIALLKPIVSRYAGTEPYLK